MVGRIWNWCRGSTPLVDFFLASPLIVLSLTDALTTVIVLGPWGYLAMSALLLIPLVFRRTFPARPSPWSAWSRSSRSC